MTILEHGRLALHGNLEELRERIREVELPAAAAARAALPRGTTVICNEPSIQFALDEDCRVQCRLSIETRTSAYHVRTGDYPEEQLSVYLTARRYGSLDPGETYVSAMERLTEICRDLVDQYVIENVLRPLQETIAIK